MYIKTKYKWLTEYQGNSQLLCSLTSDTFPISLEHNSTEEPNKPYQGFSMRLSPRRLYMDLFTTLETLSKLLSTVLSPHPNSSFHPNYSLQKTANHLPRIMAASLLDVASSTGIMAIRRAMSSASILSTASRRRGFIKLNLVKSWCWSWSCVYGDINNNRFLFYF